MKKWWLKIGVIIVILAFIFLIWWGFKRHETVMPAPASVLVQEVAVTQKNVPLAVTALGNVLAPKNVMLKALQAGQVTGIYVQRGQAVKQGQLLLTINDVQQKASVAKDKAALVQAQADYNRYHSLFIKQAVSQSDLDQYQANYLQAKATLNFDLLSLQQTRIVAPFDGIVGAPQSVLGQTDQQGNALSNVTQITVGSYVDVGDPLLQVVSSAHLQVQYEIPGETLPLLKTGQTVWVQTKAYPGKNIHATVSYIAPSVSEQTGTVTVYAALDDASVTLEPGLFVTVSQVLVPQRQVLALPGLAVASDLSGYYVYVVDQGRLKQVNVNIGERNGQWVEIKSGLALGDKVVAANLDTLQAGMAVQVSS